MHVIHTYGSTEAGFPLVSRWPDAATSQSLHVRRGYRARIVDEAGADRPVGEPGELWIRPPARPLIFLEYLDDPDATAAAVRDGWYRSGDAAVRNADDTIRFVDRMKDTVRRFGENISSSQLEAVVAGYPGVEACAVLGVPDELAGQEVLLVVMPSVDGDIDVDHLLAWLGSQVAHHMMPAYVEIVADLPRTATRKVAKSGLLEGLDLTSLRRRR